MRYYLSVTLMMSVVFLAACVGPTPTKQAKTPSQSTITTSGPQSLAIPGANSQEVNSGAGPYSENGLANKNQNVLNTPPVKVALLLPLSGKAQNIGQSMLKASQLALFDLGAETFELMPKDTMGTPNGASQAAQEAISEGAQLILGPLFTSSITAIKPIAQRANINVISFSTDWSKAGGNIHLMGFMPFVQVERVTDYAARQGLSRIALITNQDAYSNAVERTFISSANQKGVQVPKVINLRNSNLSQSDLVMLRSMNLDAVFFSIGGKQAADVAKQLEGNGIPANRVKRLGTGLWDDTILARSPEMNGAWFAAPSPSQRRIFEKNYKDLYGSTPPRLATLAYDATALAAVLGKMGGIGSDGIYRPAYNSLSLKNKNGYAGIDGVFRFNNKGLIERQLSILEYRNGRIIQVDAAKTRF